MEFDAMQENEGVSGRVARRSTKPGYSKKAKGPVQNCEL